MYNGQILAWTRNLRIQTSCTILKFMGCHSGQNYTFTISGNLAVSLFNILGWTVQLISGTVQLVSGIFKWNRKSDQHIYFRFSQVLFAIPQ